MATAERVINRLNELSQYFPHGLEYKVAYETTSFVKASITDVVKTLLEAIALVFLVMYLFLQNFRATLIPTIAVPVVLMGTFRGAVCLWLQHQHPDDVRDGAGDRPAGG
jgi:multidrug efflux pump